MKTTVNNKKRLVIAYGIFACIIFALCIRTGYVMLVKGGEYGRMAAQQQMQDEILQPERGEILDRNGNELAVNLEAYSVWVRRDEVVKNLKEDEKDEAFEKLAEELSPLIDVKEKTLADQLKESSTVLVKVKKYVDKDQADKIREASLKGVSLSQEVKRYYPMGDFLSHVLGSVNDDNEGISGLELEYDSYLAGVDGRWVKNTDVNGNPLAYGTDKYYMPEDGQNITLTIDQVIQNYTEKSVKAALEEHNAKRVSCIVMDTKTGEILSMASAPSFNPNNNSVPSDPEEKKKFNKLNSQEKMDYLYDMWRNPLISNLYEPGSTAKLITTAAVLEEGLANKNSHYYCKGYATVDGVKIRCWRYYDPHGSENLYEAVGNSCNPVFIQLAEKLGKEKFYDYLDLFGMTERTQIDFPGEAFPLVINEDDAYPVEVAAMSFGQTNAVTPIQLITAVSALGNGGNLMEPHLVKKITDADGKTVKEIEPKIVRQAVSEETADEVCKIMEYTVNNATGDKAQISGYRIGGKTGTSQVAAEGGGYTDDVIASFIGIAPMEDPQFTILYIIDSPEGGDHGGEIAAPASRDLLEKILKYKDIEPDYTEKEEEEMKEEEVKVPDVTGMKYSKAKKIIEEKGLKYVVSPEMEVEKDFIIKEQYPEAGKKTGKNGVIYLYRE